MCIPSKADLNSPDANTYGLSLTNPWAAPPFVGTLWREPTRSALPDKPLIIDGCLIPVDTIIGVNPYCLMHNELHFTGTFSFQPERWLEPEDGITESRSKRK